MPKDRRPPAMPNQTPAWVVDELLAEAVVRPTLGARRYADVLGRPRVRDLGERRPEDPATATASAGAVNASRRSRSSPPPTTGLVTDDALERAVRVLSLRGPAR